VSLMYPRLAWMFIAANDLPIFYALEPCRERAPRRMASLRSKAIR